MKKTFIIAEAGVNHNGSLKLAMRLVDAAVQAGADAIKFQTYKTENLVTRSARQAIYQKKNIGKHSTQFEMLKELELDYSQFLILKKYCDKQNILFMSTPFDLVSVDFLIKDLSLKMIKVPSGEITNAPYLYRIASLGVKNIILSTGMSTIEEIHNALAFLAYGFSLKSNPTYSKVKEFYQTNEAKEILKNRISILHCTTEYPAPFNEINLGAIDVIRDTFNLEVGLSDHSEGILVPIAAVSKGSTIIEKHFTLDKSLPGPDHKASLNPEELKEMIDSIRIIEVAIGKKVKQPTKTESKNKEIVRKSLVAAKKIKKGELFTFDNLTVKRPGFGKEPYYFWDYIGRAAEKDYEEDEVI
ncbi:N-acetylneuraminate synthase [Bacillus sp. 31A1R]|uniref:N-acetylneuraminate synthase n=1 Tax=Robertmurraya mangrovi TaxID=3098077 RepID=A0ABU5IXR3_9BACI|nr:N-acetylneuraminate synthase [Bacillus sp. 31A1R]MDZ5471964.1 N-acetylneuraminate synthase [Bacillus sp. 31A1R]